METFLFVRVYAFVYGLLPKNKKGKTNILLPELAGKNSCIAMGTYKCATQQALHRMPKVDYKKCLFFLLTLLFS